MLSRIIDYTPVCYWLGACKKQLVNCSMLSQIFVGFQWLELSLLILQKMKILETVHMFRGRSQK